MPLLDSAMLVAAKEKGFADKEGVDLVAGARDILGQYPRPHGRRTFPGRARAGADADCVEPRPDATGGADHRADGPRARRQRHHGIQRPVGAAWSITVRRRTSIRRPPARALKQVAADRSAAGKPPLRFAVVHPFSGHNYELRYWLAACGIDPGKDVEIVIVPPPLMADALASGTIDGYCVGEPWSTAAALQGSAISSPSRPRSGGRARRRC